MTSFRVEATDAGQRLDVLLAARLAISRNQAANRIDAGLVTVDGEVAARRLKPRSGALVEIADAPRLAASPPPPLPPVRYRDDHLLVIAKPAGLVVHPGAGHPDGTLVQALEAAGIPLAAGDDPVRPGIVHRLDRDTSGLLLVASSPEAFDGLSHALRERTIQRRYHALVAGTPDHPRGRIDAPIGRDPADRVRFAVVADGRPAQTRYRVLATGQAPTIESHRGVVTSLACQLGTGRTHQLRVHLTALGIPILGDRVYGAPRAVSAALGLTRPALHAAALSFDHPVTGERIDLLEPLPADLVAALSAVGLEEPAGVELTEGW